MSKLIPLISVVVHVRNTNATMFSSYFLNAIIEIETLINITIVDSIFNYFCHTIIEIETLMT